jgi:nucleotide-binding universal stress UspA family protein
MLAQRWSDAEVVASPQPPAKAILSEARRYGADAIVLGWRGHGTIRRLVAGSVSREVVAQAGRPVLVARNAARAVRRIVVGFDGSARALRAVRFLGRLAPPRDGRVVLVSVIEPLPLPPSARRMPAAIRVTLRREAGKLNRSRVRFAQRKADGAVAKLKRSGWRARSDIRFGTPLETLLQAAADHKADALVVGARATSGLRRALLGSVAAGALNHSRIPVLVVP